MGSSAQAERAVALAAVAVGFLDETPAELWLSVDGHPAVVRRSSESWADESLLELLSRVELPASGGAAPVAEVAGEPLRARLLADSAIVAPEAALEAMVSTVLEHVSEPGATVGSVQLVSQEDARGLCRLGTRPEGLVPATFVELFLAQASAHPNDYALRYATTRITYAELDARSGRLARRLIAAGVHPGDIVGLGLARGVDLITAVIAVLRCRAAYLPLDVDYPAERLSFMISDARPVVIIVDDHGAERISTLGSMPSRIFRCDGDLDGVPAVGLPDDAHVDDPMYVIYTSGSTGQPKGVVLAQKGLISLVRTQALAVGAGPGDRVLQWASISFDAAFWDITLGVLSGAELVLADAADLLPGQPLADTLAREQITVATLPPAAAAALPETAALDGGTLVSTGDVCTAAMARRWAPRLRLINGYGPTETTVGATMTEALDADRAPEVGRPFVDYEIFLCDRLRRLVPEGLPGEIYVGGPGVAVGYLNQPQLTEERFVDDTRLSTGRLYKTGDLGRWAEGQLHYEGRIDRQVKIRGFRIELGEVEAALQEHPDIAIAAVAVSGDQPSNRRLVAGVQPLEGRSLTAEQIRSFLRQRVPGHLVPSEITVVERLPVTPNGKIDISALTSSQPEPGAAATTGEDRLSTITALFAAAVGQESVAADADFFEAGGDSISAVRLVGALRERLEVAIDVTQFFERPTPHHVAELLDQEATRCLRSGRS